LRKITAILAIAWVFLLLSVSVGTALVSSNVPRNHWSYDDIDRLLGLGLIDSALSGNRPFSRLEMARLIGEALDKTKGEHKNEALRSMLARLQKEFQGELVALGKLEGIAATSFFKPFRNPYLRYIYGNDDFELQNQVGDTFSKHSNLRMGFSSEMRLGEHLSFFLHPEWRYREHQFSPEQNEDVKIVEGYLKINITNLELEVGRDSLWWGPGYHGTLLLSNNAQALDLIKLSNPRPVLLPWIFEYLGPFQFTTFIAELEKARTISKARLWGMRLNFKPHPLLELGLSRSIMLGGEGRPSLGLGDYGKIFLANEENKPGKLNNNQLASADLSLRIPMPKTFSLLKSITLYTEIGGEDEANWGPSHIGYMGGAYLVLFEGKTDLRIEYANNHVSSQPTAWYTHSVYQSGYNYKGKTIGHHMGSDADDLFVRVTHYLGSDLLLGLNFDRERRRTTAAVTEIRDYGEFELSLFNWHNMRLTARYRY